MAAAAEERRPHTNGLYLSQIERVARAIGYPLRRKNPCDFHNDKGILHVQFKNGDLHVVILMAGLIFDTDDLTVWLPAEYKAAKRIKYRAILVPA